MRLLFISIIGLVAILNFAFIPQKKHQHHFQNKNKFAVSAQLPLGYNDLFAGSGECEMCHTSMTNSQGESVSIINDWRSSMMANSAKDPLWRAKVSHETLVNPELASIIENKCTSCHAPMGHFNAHYNGLEYSIEDMENDPIALDGVSCTMCHQITEESLGNYSGAIAVGENKEIWGPFENPFTNSMVQHTGYTPKYSEHINNSKLCGSCHTLLTPTVDLQGNLTGTEFVEQAIYQEWLNSDFSESNITCQTCHVPEINDAVQIGSMPPWIEPRSPFGMHHLAGANVFMLKILKNNIETLGLTADPVHFDSTIVRAERLLQTASVYMEVNEVDRTEDTLFVDLILQNMAGHKFPTGFPSRRAFIELHVVDQNSSTLFHSGAMDNNYQLLYEDATFEPHYNLINQDNQVQIYELVMGDVEQNPTTVLLYANEALKDNRLPPSGFVSTHPSYDTVQVFGEALQDGDFNQLNGVEGTGADVVHYAIPVYGNAGTLTVNAKLHYKTINDKWLENTFSYSSLEIDLFEQLYTESDKEPVLVAENSLTSLATNLYEMEDVDLQIYPNPADQYLFVKTSLGLGKFRLRNMAGNIVITGALEEIELNEIYRISLPETKGVYLLELLQEDRTLAIR